MKVELVNIRTMLDSFRGRFVTSPARIRLMLSAMFISDLQEGKGACGNYKRQAILVEIPNCPSSLVYRFL